MYKKKRAAIRTVKLMRSPSPMSEVVSKDNKQNEQD